MAFGHHDSAPTVRAPLLPAFAAQGQLEARAETEWQCRKAEHRVIVLAEQVFHDREQFEMRVNPVTAGEINLLISGRKIPVRQKEAVAEERITQESAVITTADQISV